MHMSPHMLDHGLLVDSKHETLTTDYVLKEALCMDDGLVNLREGLLGIYSGMLMYPEIVSINLLSSL